MQVLADLWWVVGALGIAGTAMIVHIVIKEL